MRRERFMMQRTSSRRSTIVAALACAALLYGCGGGGSGASPAPAPQVSAAPGGLQSLRVTMTIAGPPATKASRSTRKPKFVSPSTNGVQIRAYLHSDTQHATVIGSSATDVSSGSAACGGTAGFPRTCSVVVPVPAGVEDFIMTTYDAAPSGGSFSGANVLGIDLLSNQTITLNAANTLSIFISGLIAKYGAVPAFASLPADGASHTYGILIQPQDFDNNPITAGTNDPYANPIIVSLAEQNQTGHAVLLFNGNPSGTTATLTHSTDTIAVRYDGGGAPGYGIGVQLTANNVNPLAIQVSPLYITSTSPYFSSGALAFFGVGQSAVLNVSEANAPANDGYALNTAGTCTGVLQSYGIAGASAITTVNITAGSTASPLGACTVVLGDTYGTGGSVAISNTVSGVPITINGFVVTTYNAPGPSAGIGFDSIAAGPDGNLWVWEADNTGTGSVSRITTAGTFTQYTVPGANPFGLAIAAGPDGNLWFTDYNHAQVDRIATTLGTVTQFAAGGTQPVGITAGPDGNLWYALGGSSAIGRMTPGGAVTTFPLPGGFIHPDFIAGGGDGNIWFTCTSPGAIGRVTPAGTITMFPTGVAGSNPNGIAAGPDGNVWFADYGAHAIGRITPAGTITEFALPSNGSPIAITTGPDGNLWFTESAGNPLGKVTPSGTVTEYAIPGVLTDAFLVTGPDGNLWLSSLAVEVQKVQI
ncbi:MAG TPA: hypothetical protein VGN14_07800 [Candidatus Elarobacter sp.]